MAISAAKLEQAMEGLREAWRGSEDDQWEDVRVLQSVRMVDEYGLRGGTAEADGYGCSTGRSIYALLGPASLETVVMHVTQNLDQRKSSRTKTTQRCCRLPTLVGQSTVVRECTTTSFTRLRIRCLCYTSRSRDEVYRHQTKCTSSSSLLLSNSRSTQWA